MKKIFLLMPLAFLALTGCANNGEDSSATNKPNDGTSTVEPVPTPSETNTEVETEDKTEATPDKPTGEIGICDPVENNKYYFGFTRDTDVYKPATDTKPELNIPAGNYYITGKMSGFYFETSNEIANAASVIAVKAGDAWNLKVADAAENEGKYVAVKMSSDGQHINIVYSDTAFAWNYVESLKTFQGDLDGKTIGLGTEAKKTHTTMSAYDAGKYGTDGNFLAHLYGEGGETNPEPNPDPTPDTPVAGKVAPEENKEFYFAFERDKDVFKPATDTKPELNLPAGNYYITGKMKGFYFETSHEVANAVAIKTIKAGDAWHLQVVDSAANSAGKYIAVKMSSDGQHINIIYSDTAFAWNYVDSLNTFQGELDGKTIGLGTEAKKTHDTMSAYDAGKYGTDGNFLAHLISK